MANKQINELSELTTASGTDLLLTYDTNESGAEKTKKMEVNSLIGGWILVAEYDLSSETIDETIPWDDSDIRVRWHGDESFHMHLNGDTGANYPNGRIFTNGTNNVSVGHSTLTGIVIGDAYLCSQITEIHLDAGTQPFGTSRMARNVSTQHLYMKSWEWNNTDAVTSLRFYHATNTVTGNLKVYKWNDVRIT